MFEAVNKSSETLDFANVGAQIFVRLLSIVISGLLECDKDFMMSSVKKTNKNFTH